MKKITVLFFLFSTICYTQSYRVEGLSISTKEDITSIYFKNGNSDGFYLDGVFMESYGVLKLSVNQFKQFIEDTLKASKKSSIVIERDLYTVTRFDFSEDEIFFNVKDKVGTLTSKQLKEIIKQNNL
jgi:hypothetical protein